MTLNPLAAVFLKHIGHSPVSIDVLIECGGLTAVAVSSMLLPMELDGLMSRSPLGKVQRIYRYYERTSAAH